MSGSSKPLSAELGAQGAYAASIATPADAAELSAFLKMADKEAMAIVAGKPARIPLQAPSKPTVFCDLAAKQNRVLEHSQPDQVLQAQTGITIAELNKQLTKHNQFLPVRAPANWTLLDAINRGDSGTLEQGYGAMRDLVLGTTALLADGTVINTGGRVVKNVTGYDVTKLVVGSHASLAIPVAVYLRVYALPETSLTLVWSFDSLWRLMNCALALLKSGLPFAALEAVQNDKPKSGVGKFVLLGQIFGLKAVTDEIAASAKELVGAPQTELQGADEAAIWSDIAEFFLDAGYEQTLNVVAAPTHLPDIAAKLPFGCRWQMRASKGRLTAICADTDEALGSLARFSQDNKVPMTVAFADNRYNYRVRQSPVDDSVKAQLKRRIKQELDPNGTLNPYVDL
jgi:glycolate oxidase FAD binding subunit